MPWVFLLLAVASFAIAMTTASVALAVVCILAALALLVAWIMGLVAHRIGTRARDDVMMIDPEELHRLREQAEARRTGPPADRSPTGD